MSKNIIDLKKKKRKPNIMHKQLIFNSRFDVLYYWHNFKNKRDLKSFGCTGKRNKSLTNIKSNTRRHQKRSCDKRNRKPTNKTFQNRLKQYIRINIVGLYEKNKKKFIKFSNIHLSSK